MREVKIVGRIRPRPGLPPETRMAVKCEGLPERECKAWRTVDDWLAAVNGALISHGLCPTCARIKMARAGFDPDDMPPLRPWFREPEEGAA